MVDSSSWLFLAMRWGMGFVGPVAAAALAWKTVQIRSTQSATGILYVAMTLVLFGELTSLIGGTGRRTDRLRAMCRAVRFRVHLSGSWFLAKQAATIESLRPRNG